MNKTFNIARVKVQVTTEEDMKIKLLKDCKEHCPKNVRLMGLDFGSKTIGVAVSDSAQGLATPVTTIKRTKLRADLQQLGELAKEYEVRGFIIGLPINMDGSEGPRCDATRSFADELGGARDIFGEHIFIAYQDERLSTRTVDDFVDSRVDMKRKSKRAAKDNGIIDALAAQVILQSALDARI